MRCGDCIHCRWDDSDIWCDVRKNDITKYTQACEQFKKQLNHTCGECSYNVKAENECDLDFCAAHDLYDFTSDDRKACDDFVGSDNDD